jgi:hypothetical protein
MLKNVGMHHLQVFCTGWRFDQMYPYEETRKSVGEEEARERERERERETEQPLGITLWSPAL